MTAPWTSLLQCMTSSASQPNFWKKGSSTDLDLFYMAAWTIWGNRNNAIHNDTDYSPTQAWEIAKRTQTDFVTLSTHDHPSHPTDRTHWSPPPQGFHKINVDGATANDGEHASIGIIIRDHTGATVGALNKLLPSTFSAAVIEAYVLHQGVLFAAEMGTSKAIFESDALSLIQTLNSNENGGELGHILQDIKSSAQAFSWSSFKHLKRNGNRAAYELAREAKFSGQVHTWKGVSPPFIQQILEDDLS
ncbi:uncharacterized protein LOC142628796 [Castanea sativa]|uniref:uncharacterized protein LOC142628796 n=1 Tax=Castanea sativa TaxID=21020 RepID=UPI003F6514DC